MVWPHFLHSSDLSNVLIEQKIEADRVDEVWRGRVVVSVLGLGALWCGAHLNVRDLQRA